MGELFARLGTEDAPRGDVLTAYRVARRALRSELERPSVVNEVLSQLRAGVSSAVERIFDDAADCGFEQSVSDLAVYELGAPDISPEIVTLEQQAIASVLSALDQQLDGVRAIVAGGYVDDALILGDDERVGLLSPGAVIGEAARWAAIIALTAYTAGVSGRVDRDRFRRQAIAAIDERTTDCCLRVHGQVVGLDDDFKLTGTPRFADRMRNPPFHWYCRTSVALVRREDAEDDVTREMREAARAELRAREQTGQRVRIHPAHARSRRSGGG